MVFHFRLLALAAVPVTVTLALIACTMQAQAQASTAISVTFATCGRACSDSQDLREEIRQFRTDTLGEKTQDKLASLFCPPHSPGAKAVNPNALIDPSASRPAVTSLSPRIGPDTGGSMIVITGSGFTAPG